MEAAACDAAALYEHAPCGHLVLTLDGRVVSANATLTAWLRRNPGSLAGARFRDLLTLPGRILYETNLAPVVRLQGAVEEVALDLATAKGPSMPVIASASELRNEAGDPVGVHMVLMRAQARKRYESELRQRETTASSDLAAVQETAMLREQFIAVLGHDLRNPLASLLGAARLLRREVLSDKAGRVLDMMEGSVDRMAGLIDDVMDFARGQLGGGIVLDLREQALEPVLRQVIGEFETARPEATIVCDFDLPSPVGFDANRLGQLVSNLLGNAFTHGDPKQPVRVSASLRSERLELTVANSGNPIPEAAKARLFQPFFRGEVRPSQQGLGLGLHIASEIARAHHGTLVATSSADETRFTFEMPVSGRTG